MLFPTIAADAKTIIPAALRMFEVNYFIFFLSFFYAKNVYLSIWKRFLFLKGVFYFARFLVIVGNETL